MPLNAAWTGGLVGSKIGVEDAVWREKVRGGVELRTGNSSKDKQALQLEIDKLDLRRIRNEGSSRFRFVVGRYTPPAASKSSSGKMFVSSPSRIVRRVQAPPRCRSQLSLQRQARKEQLTFHRQARPHIKSAFGLPSRVTCWGLKRVYGPCPRMGSAGWEIGVGGGATGASERSARFLR